MWQDEFIDLLNHELRVLRRKNPRFSTRAFARKIGLSPGALSDTLRRKKKWDVSSKRAAEILDKLSVKDSVKNRLLVKMGESPKFKKVDLKYSDYEILTDWMYYPILFSFDLPEGKSTPEAISRRLGVEEKKVRNVVEDLLRRGLLVETKEGIKRPTSVIKTTDGPPNAVIRKYHDANLELSRRALAELSSERRDFSSMTFAGSEKQLAGVREEIRRLYEKVTALMDDDENTSVFRMSVQLFPMEFGPDEN